MNFQCNCHGVSRVRVNYESITKYVGSRGAGEAQVMWLSAWELKSSVLNQMLYLENV